jgi:peptide/nickel transport system substrate-binding protein
VLTNSRPVAKSLMEKAGFKVDMQDMDWQSVSRRSGRGAPSQGRWSAS